MNVTIEGQKGGVGEKTLLPYPERELGAKTKKRKS